MHRGGGESLILCFLQGDAAALPFFEQFDLVTSFFVLHWVSDQAAALQALERGLRPEGRALLVVSGAHPQNLSPNAVKLARSERWRDRFPDFAPQRWYYMPEEYGAFVAAAGLEIIELKGKVFEKRFDSMAEFVAALRPLVTFADHLEEEEKEEFI